MSAYGVEHMYAGPYIGSSIDPIQLCYQPGKDVVSGHYLWTEQMTVWPECGNDQKYCHSDTEKESIPVIGFFVTGSLI